MTIKKLTVIAAAGTMLLAGAISISMRLTSPHEMEIKVPETPVAQGEEDASKTLGDMENIPLYYDDTKKLLLPLRNVMEGLGGSVKWNKETRETEISYRGRTLKITQGEEDAKLNGYIVTLPEPVEMINGCLYADASVISAYYTGEVDFNTETRQVTLQTKDNATPILAVREIFGQKEGKSYRIEVPVIVGLNDNNYEKSLNEKNLQEMQAYADAFLAAEPAEGGDGLLQMEIHTELWTKDFVSLWWEGTMDGVSVKQAKNFDLLAQKVVTLADVLSAASLEEVKTAAGDGWTEDRFYLTSENELVLIKGNDENGYEMHHWTTEGKPLEWQRGYKELFQK